MRLYPEKLAAHLQRQLLPVYLVSGDEPLQLQECCDLVRAAARSGGCSDRVVIEAAGRDFDWRELHNSTASLSLFAQRRLIELRVPDGKPGAEGSRALCDYLEQAAEGDVLLVVAGRIDKQSTSSKWFRAIDRVGASVQVWPVDAANLPRWLRQRLAAADLAIDADTLALLAERVEGNLLAAVQEVEKLKLLATDGRVTLQTVLDAVADNARYNLFDMADSALRGDAATGLRMLHGLRGEGTEPAVALWALAREIRTLCEARQAMDAGHSAEQALGARKVWPKRMPLLQGALRRHDRASLDRLLQRAAEVDGSIKGFADGRPWDNLEDLLLGLCGDSAG